ncbi:MAG TPA: N-acetyl-gamma-glutamyl-phosphate reductase [Nitrososphaerales archaeon]|nr:N-acetyl-gamma-glutamyl-phosphate reductase [Nitrososphaerales archaeon]
MTDTMRVGIVGASGYVGGELFRILVNHPNVKVTIATSKQYDGEVIYRVHPNLRSFTELKFTAPKLDSITSNCDFVFTAVPHGSAVKIVPDLVKTGLKIVDMSADFRLQNVEAYRHWYHYEHPHPEMLATTPLGIPELYRDKIQSSNLVANPGCMAVTSILAIAPFAKSGIIDLDHIVVDSKIGSSGGGTKPSIATHHAERYGVIRPYKPVDHRHTAEIEQEVSKFAGRKVKVSMTPHAVNIVRGILCTIHTFGKGKLETPIVWKALRDFYKDSRFIRFVKDKKGLAKYPDPKVLPGSNFCDIGFEIDERLNRLLLLSATDNLMKGAAGNGVQCMNLMARFEESAGLLFPGLHPV